MRLHRFREILPGCEIMKNMLKSKKIEHKFHRIRKFFSHLFQLNHFSCLSSLPTFILKNLVYLSGANRVDLKNIKGLKHMQIIWAAHFNRHCIHTGDLYGSSRQTVKKNRPPGRGLSGQRAEQTFSPALRGRENHNG